MRQNLYVWAFIVGLVPIIAKAEFYCEFQRVSNSGVIVTVDTNHGTDENYEQAITKALLSCTGVGTENQQKNQGICLDEASLEGSFENEEILVDLGMFCFSKETLTIYQVCQAGQSLQNCVKQMDYDDFMAYAIPERNREKLIQIFEQNTGVRNPATDVRTDEPREAKPFKGSRAPSIIQSGDER